MSDAIKQTVTTLNTILLFIVLGFVGFIGNATVDNGKKLAAIQASQVTREEMTLRIAEVRLLQDKLAADIVSLQIEMAKLKRP